MKKLLTSNTGFTLIELLIVITIIVIVIGVGAVSYTTVARNSRNSERASGLNKIAEALEEYYADNHTYPNTNNAGQFETAGRGANDKIRCLLGGTFAQNVTAPSPADWVCTKPVTWDSGRVYIGNGEPKKIPFDPLYSDFQNVEASYAYASNAGQSYVLVTRHYEGTAPASNRFTQTTDKYYWDYYVANPVWGSSQVIDGKQYVVRSPNR